MRLLLLPLLLGCQPTALPDSPAGDTASPASPLPLDPWRLLGRLELKRNGQHLLLDRRRGWSFVLDSRGELLSVDPLFHLDLQARCLPTDHWPETPYREEWRGSCEQGEVELQRGLLAPDSPAVGVALDEDALELWLLSSDGSLQRASYDVLGADPWRLLRLEDAGELGGSWDGDSRLAAGPGGLWAADGAELLWWPGEGEPSARWSLAAPIADLLPEGEALWIATEEGLYHLDGPGGEPESWGPAEPGSRLAADPRGGGWISLPGEGALLRFEAGGTGARIEAAVTGPLALDPAALVLHAATTGGLRSWRVGGDEPAFYAARSLPSPPVDLAADGDHLLWLLGGYTLELRADELLLDDGQPPLSVLVVTFLERPHTERDPWPCVDRRDDDLADFVQRAQHDLALLRSTPAAVALGVVPELARALRGCGLHRALRESWEGPWLEAGVLYHELAEDCPASTDPMACLGAYLEAGRDALGAAGLEARWVSGLAPQEDLGLDWLAALEEQEPSPPYLFFGLSVLPSISSGDPRAKEPFPPELAASTTPRAPASLEDFESWAAGEEGQGDGKVPFYPGVSLSAFNLGGCADLLHAECSYLALGGGSQFDPADFETLDLLLHRALAHRGEAGTFYFHLPDLGAYDYTAACTDGPPWRPADCPAALLSAWLDELDRRFVSRGLARWALPSELE